METSAWKLLVSRREKCILFLQENATEMEPLLDAYQEICEIESLLSDLWNRLETHARKSETRLSHNGTLANRWIYQVAIPLTIAATMFEESEGST